MPNLTVYPNPTNSNLTVDLGKTITKIKTVLTNSLGLIISTQQFKSVDLISFEIDVPTGIYFLQLETTAGLSKVIRVMIK